MNKVVDSTKADLVGWLALAAEVESLFGPMVSELSFHEALSQKITQGQAFCIRQDDSQGGAPLLGGVVISKEDNEIIWLAVSARQRGNGLGERLLSQALERLDKSRVISVVTFDSRVEVGLPARRLYVKHGFIDKEKRGLNPAGIPIVLMVRE